MIVFKYINSNQEEIAFQVTSISTSQNVALYLKGTSDIFRTTRIDLGDISEGILSQLHSKLACLMVQQKSICTLASLKLMAKVLVEEDRYSERHG